MIMFNIYLTLKLNTIIFVLIIKYSIFVLLHQIFNIMELRIKEICKEKGILQKELADKYEQIEEIKRSIAQKILTLSEIIVL